MTPLRQQGLSLIEVMIALAVFSFGLLALAALMGSGLKYNTSALHRSYATSQAYDMADRMRANRQGLIDGHYNSLIDPSDDLIHCVHFDSDSDSDIVCDSEQMAEYDSWEWNNANARLLPEGAGTVKRGNSGIYTITISWNDDRDPGTVADSFVSEFKP